MNKEEATPIMLSGNPQVKFNENHDRNCRTRLFYLLKAIVLFVFVVHLAPYLADLSSMIVLTTIVLTNIMLDSYRNRVFRTW